MPPGSAFVAYFGHIMGYGAGYYGYAWADAIAADMATVFEKSPDGFFDQAAGRRMRNEIYSVGDSRDINVSIEKFLGRPRSLGPFLKKIGVDSALMTSYYPITKNRRRPAGGAGAGLPPWSGRSGTARAAARTDGSGAAGCQFCKCDRPASPPGFVSA